MKAICNNFLPIWIESRDLCCYNKQDQFTKPHVESFVIRILEHMRKLSQNFHSTPDLLKSIMVLFMESSNQQQQKLFHPWHSSKLW